MCTAITFQTKNHYFGRNLDFEFSFQEVVTITPRNYVFPFRCCPSLEQHYAMIGMAAVDNNYPLYFDATNECGLSMAGLYFPGNAVYLPKAEGVDNVAPFEFIPWLLCQCANIEQAEEKLKRLNLVDLPYSDKYPLSPLHWLIADKYRSIVVEPTADGTKVYDNPFGVLTNNPPFSYHLYHLSNYLNLTSEEPISRFATDFPLEAYSRGMGGIGLPGDLSSSSRFVRAAFTKLNSVYEDNESASISQFFHILGSVSQTMGCVKVGDGYEKTIYSSCCNADTGAYYYKTYENSQITCVKLNTVDLSLSDLFCYPLVTGQQIRYQNEKRPC